MNDKSQSQYLPKELFFAVWNVPELRGLIKSHMWPGQASANWYDYKDAQAAINNGYYELCIQRSLIDPLGRYDIQKAIMVDNLQLVKLLTGTDTDFSTAPDTAAEYGNLRIIKYLHKKSIGSWGETMDWAAMNGHFDVIYFLHNNRAEGCTSITMDGAVKNGHLEVVKFLHEFYADEDYSTAAMNAAAKNGHLRVVEFLHYNRGEGCTTDAMDEAAARGYLKVVEFLHHHRAEGCTIQAMKGAAYNNHFKMVRFLYFNRSEGGNLRVLYKAYAKKQ